MPSIPPVAPPTFPKVSPSKSPARVPAGVESQAIDNGGGFTDAITDALNTVGTLENRVTEAGQQAATGDLTSVSDFMIATSEAQLSTEITVAIRDRAIAAFNDIMRMQI